MTPRPSGPLNVSFIELSSTRTAVFCGVLPCLLSFQLSLLVLCTLASVGGSSDAYQSCMAEPHSPRVSDQDVAQLPRPHTRASTRAAAAGGLWLDRPRSALPAVCTTPVSGAPPAPAALHEPAQPREGAPGSISPVQDTVSFGFAPNRPAHDFRQPVVDAVHLDPSIRAEIHAHQHPDSAEPFTRQPRLLAVHHSTQNPVQRPPGAPPICGPFALHLDPCHAAVVRGPSYVNQLESEVLSWSLSYLYDLDQFLADAEHYPPDLPDLLHTVRAHLSGVFRCLNTRESELYIRSTQPQNAALLNAIERKRRGVAPGVSLDEGVADILRDQQEVYIRQAVKTSAQQLQQQRKNRQQQPDGGSSGGRRDTRQSDRQPDRQPGRAGR